MKLLPDFQQDKNAELVSTISLNQGEKKNATTDVEEVTLNVEEETIGGFTEEQIKDLLEIQWWNWDDSAVVEAAPLLASDNIDEFIEFAKNKKEK